MINKIKEYFSFFMILPLVFGILLFKVIYNNPRIFHNYIELIGLFMSFIIGVIVLVKCEKESVVFYINLGVSFLLVGIVIFIKIVFIHSKYFNNYIMSMIIFYYNNISYILDFLLKSTELKKICRNQIIIFLQIAILIQFGSMHINDFYIILGKINFIFMIIITIILYFMVYTNIDNKEERFFNYMFIFNRLIYYFMNFLKEKYSIDMLFFRDIFKYFSYILAYIMFFEFFFNRLLNIEKGKLRQSEELQIKLNRLLKRKNRELFDLNKCIEKSEVTKTRFLEIIKDGIITVKSDRITSINSVILDKYPFLKKENYIGLTYIKYIRMFCKHIGIHNISLNRIKNNNDNESECKKIAKLKINSDEFYVYFFKIDYLESVVYFKNITYIKRSHKIKSDYDEYIKEEKLKDIFYSNVSHELRTPINVISSAIQLNSIYLDSDDMIKIKNNNKRINQNCKRLIRTINNFIDTNKIQEGYLVPNLKVYNIVSVIENISLACNKYIKKINNTLIFDSCEEEIYAKIDKDMMERIIMNILSNMVKYGVEGGKINIDISINNGNVITTINNSLYTISEEVIKEMFDKFSKLNKSLNREKEGSGLGMFLCKALIKLQGGKLMVESSEDKGTSFIIEIPYIKDTANLEVCEDEYNIQELDYSVDIEFSDIYL